VCAAVGAAYPVPGGAFPVTGFGDAGAPIPAGPVPRTDPPTSRQCGRTGFAVTWIQRQKSRASTRVAPSHGTATAAKKRNHRNNAIPYDRCVVAGNPRACRSRQYAATGPTTRPAPACLPTGRWATSTRPLTAGRQD
jgi:hypothetical protein